MESSSLKNMVILKNLPSNIVDEAIIVLKSNKKIKRLEKIEQNKGVKNKEEQKNDKDYILKEAEMLVNKYVSQIEKKDTRDIFNKTIKQKYKRIKKYSIVLTIISVIEMILLIFN